MAKKQKSIYATAPTEAPAAPGMDVGQPPQDQASAGQPPQPAEVQPPPQQTPPPTADQGALAGRTWDSVQGLQPGQGQAQEQQPAQDLAARTWDSVQGTQPGQLPQEEFSQKVAAATNVPSQGGPEPSELSASTGETKLTHFGYAGDLTPDKNSYYGIGDRGNIQTPGVSVALTQSERQARFGVTGSSTGKSFEYQGKTYVDDDTAPESDRRIDVYDPYGSEKTSPSEATVGEKGTNAYTITGVPYKGTKGPPKVSESAPRTKAAVTETGKTTTAAPGEEEEEEPAKTEKEPSKAAAAEPEQQPEQPTTTQELPPQEQPEEEENIYPGGISPQQRATLAATYPQKKAQQQEEPEEEGTPASEALKAALSQYQASPTQTAQKANLANLLQTHASSTPDDGRVKTDPITGLFKGTHFRGDDPLHQEALSTVPAAQKYKLALAQEAIDNKTPMHLSYGSAQASPALIPSRTSRTQEYQQQPGRQLAESQVAGHTILPTAIGVTFGKKAGENNRGFIQGISSSVIASNANHFNSALGAKSPYPNITDPQFAQDFEGYVANLNNGWTGDGHAKVKGTDAVPVQATKGYEPHLLTEPQANFMNAILHNVAAKNKGGQSKQNALDLAQANGRQVGPEGETNPLREMVDAGRMKRAWYPGMPETPGKPWTEEMLEPSVRHFNAELIQKLHDQPNEMAEAIRPPEGTEQIHQALARQGVPHKDLVAANVMGGPVGESGKLPKAQRLQTEGQEPAAEEVTKKPPKRAQAKAVEKPPPEELEEGGVTPETERILGPRPKEKKQAALWDRVGARLDSQIPEGIPLVPNRDEKKKFKTDSKGNPDYKKVNYDIANAPILQKEGKALGRAIDSSGKESVAKAPAGTEDKLAKGDLHYLKPADRLRVSHLNEVSAVDAFADKLLKEYKGIEHLPEVMAGKDWYSEAEQILRKHFGKDADFVANLLGATSAGTNVKVNYKMAMEAYHNWLEGKYDKHIDLYRKAHEIRGQGKGSLAQHVLDQGITSELPKTDAAAMAHYIAHHDIVPKQSNGKLFGHNSLAVLKVLAHTWLDEVEAPKTPNFAGNLSGRTLQATIDMWAARTMRRLGYEGHTDEPWMIQPAAETGVTDTDFGLSQLAFRKAAEKIGIAPSSLQAILWFNEQKHYQDRGWERQIDPSERDYRPMLQKYQPRQKAA